MSAANWLPLVNTRVAAVLEEMGWAEDRDFWVAPDMPDDDARRGAQVMTVHAHAAVARAVARDAAHANAQARDHRQ